MNRFIIGFGWLVAACVAIAGTGTSNEFRVDTCTGVRTAAATEKIQYSTAWLEGQDLRGVGNKLDGYGRFVVISMEGYTGSSLSWARVLVRISADIPGFDYHDMAYPQTGGDLIFTDYDETVAYDHDIDEWNVNGESLVWVKIPTLTPGLKIKMGYGKSGVTMNANAANTWKGYAGVWHMGSEGALEKDATSNGLNATPYGTGATLQSRDQGVCGKAQVTGVETPNYDSLALGGVFTVSGWFRADAAEDGYAKLFYRNDSGWADGGWGVECKKSSTDLTVVGSSNSTCLGVTIPTLVNQWVYCAFVYNGASVTVYANGTQISAGTIVAAKDNGKALKIARERLTCDEVRLCKGAFSSTQIKFDYDTVNNKSFCTFSPSYRIADNPKVEIAANGLKLFEGTGAGCYDWTPTRGGLYEFEHLTYDGEATVLDKLTATFQVPDQPISADEVTVEAYAGTYDGKGHGLGVSGPEGTVFRFATAQGGPFEKSLLFTNVCDVTVWYEVSGEGYLSLTNSSTVKITPKSIEEATVILGDPLAYTGEEQRQTISQVTVDGLDVTYTVEGDSATERGEHTMTLTGTGDFEGTVEKTYAIQDVAVSARQRYPWNGLVDLKFTVTGAAGTTFDVTFTATDEIGGTNVPMKTLIREDGSAASATAAVSPGTYRWAWNAAADLPKGWTCRGVSISADANVRTYTVRFNANGGTGTMQDEKFTYGIAQALTANVFKKDGCMFAGWATSAEGEKVYDNKQSVSDLTTTPGATVNLYAVWKSLGGVQLWENGPYWAECNIGATKPEECGYYFWWGDTVGYKRNSASNGWVSVKDGSSFSFSSGKCPTYDKENSQLQSMGYIDSTGNLVAAHDAATVHLGATWRMPTGAEISALINNCDTEWTTLNGVNGRLVKGRGTYKSKSIFFPAAGYGDVSYFRGLGSYGFCWSSTPTSNPYYAWFLGFNLDNFDQHNSYGIGSYDGLSVRPVRGFDKYNLK